jgi:hypothetical protein
VKVKGNKVEIEGERHTLARESDTNYKLFPGKERVSLEVDLKGADMAAWLPQLPVVLSIRTCRTHSRIPRCNRPI